MNISALQIGLLDFCWREPNEIRSFSTINNICIKLYNQFFPEKNSKTAKYDIIYPLVRVGVIEAYESGHFALSPSVALIGDTKIAFINCRHLLDTTLNDFAVYESEIGINVYSKNENVLRFIKRNGIAHSPFSISAELNRIHSFSYIVDSWNDDLVIDTRGYVKFSGNGTWTTSSEAPTPGLYKKTNTAYAAKAIKLSDGRWKVVPPVHNNIDAFSIALIASRIEDGKFVDVEYCLTRNMVEIKTPYFPLLVERLLVMNSILHCEVDNEIMIRKYFLDRGTFGVLNKLFNSKIKSYE